MKTPIADRVREMRSRAEGGNAFTREQAAVAAARVPRELFPLGVLIPDAELMDVHGAKTTLYAELAGRPGGVRTAT